MAAELTFTPGRVPGIARSQPRPSTTAARRPSAHGAAPVSPPRDLLPGMTLAQRRALAALVHTPAGALDLRCGASRRGSNVAWIALFLCTLAWTVAIAVELTPELRVARAIDAPRVAQPHVGPPAA